MPKATLSIDDEKNLSIATKYGEEICTLNLQEFYSILYSVFNDNEVAHEGLTFSNSKYGVVAKGEEIDVLIPTKGLVFVIMPHMQSDIVFSEIDFQSDKVELTCPDLKLSISILLAELKAFNAELMARDRTKVEVEGGESHYYRNAEDGASCFSWKHQGTTIGGKIDVAQAAVKQAQQLIEKNPEQVIDDLKAQIEASTDEARTKGLEKVLEIVSTEVTQL